MGTVTAQLMSVTLPRGFVLSLGFIAVVLSANVNAGVYKCQQDGKTAFSDTPCQSQAERQAGRLDNKPMLSIGAHNGAVPVSPDAATNESSPGTNEPNDPYSDDAKIQGAMLRVKGELKDPDSAKFKDVVVSQGAVCGLVNAKNAFGGYTGFGGFVVDAKTVALESSSGIFQILYSVLADKYQCKKE